MTVLSIKDNKGDNYTIKDLKSFYRHILEYHASGTSIHEEHGHYFTVDDDFRSKIKKLYQKSY